MKKVFSLIKMFVCIIIVTGLSGTSVFAEIINPGFELGQTTGWPENDSSGCAAAVIQNSTGKNFDAHSGVWVARFYGIAEAGSDCREQVSLSQSITIPVGTQTLNFWLKIGTQDGLDLAYGALEIKIDNQSFDPKIFYSQEHVETYADWEKVFVNISSYADGNEHLMTFDFVMDIAQDPEGGTDLSIRVDDISLSGEEVLVPGDIYNNDGVNLTDAIISLQITAGINPAGAINLNNDVDANSVIGLENPIYILQKVAGLRPE